MGKTKQQRREPKPPALRDKFVPRFWENIDGRMALVKEIRRSCELLKDYADAESTRKDMLCQRATVVPIQPETMEATATDTGKLASGVDTHRSRAPPI